MLGRTKKEKQNEEDCIGTGMTEKEVDEEANHNAADAWTTEKWCWEVRSISTINRTEATVPDDDKRR